ncbi:MAG TPA: hypothetical protein VH593_09720, partial [Ktedonobacteraceae bacterium]
MQLYDQIIETTALPICTLCKVNVVPQKDPILGWDICPSCKRGHSPHRPNTYIAGAPSPLPAFSIEFEIQASWSHFDDLEQALILLKHGFIRTKDGSVDDEYKSPIYRSLAPFRAVLPILETLSDLVSGACGTHLHVSLPVKERLRPMHRSVFEPLVMYLEDHEEETIAFWGRTFSPYASQLLG